VAKIAVRSYVYIYVQDEEVALTFCLHGKLNALVDAV
jgi:hypothetical protein